MGFFSLLLALAKVSPALAGLIKDVAAELHRLRLAQTHAKIDAAIDAPTTETPTVAAVPPSFALKQLRDPGTPSGTLPPAP